MRTSRVLPTLLLLLGACGGGPPSATAVAGELHISNGFAYEPIIPASGAAYLTITNDGTTPDTLMEVSSPAAAGAMLHASSMGHLMALPIPAGGTVALEPGGTHIMFSDFSEVPKAGDSLSVTLVFARTGSVSLRLPVRKYGDK